MTKTTVAPPQEDQTHGPIVPVPSDDPTLGPMPFPPETLKPEEPAAVKEEPAPVNMIESLRSFIADLEELDRSREHSRMEKFHLIIVAEDDEVRCETHPDLTATVSAVRNLIQEGTRVNVFVFKGLRYHISKGSLKYLVSPDGSKSPLWEDPPELEVDDSGVIGGGKSLVLPSD